MIKRPPKYIQATLTGFNRYMCEYVCAHRYVYVHTNTHIKQRRREHEFEREMSGHWRGWSRGEDMMKKNLSMKLPKK